MQEQRIAGGASSSVSGLGVCDVWRLELSAEQWPWLLDELEEIRGPLEDEVQEARARSTVDDSETVRDEVAALEHELRVVRMMRAQLPSGDHRAAVVFVGPTELVLDLVRGTLRNVVDALSDVVTAQRRGDLPGSVRLVDTACVASEWARTFADCQRVEFFNLDVSADPALGHSSDH